MNIIISSFKILTLDRAKHKQTNLPVMRAIIFSTIKGIYEMSIQEIGGVNPWHLQKIDAAVFFFLCKKNTSIVFVAAAFLHAPGSPLVHIMWRIFRNQKKIRDANWQGLTPPNKTCARPLHFNHHSMYLKTKMACSESEALSMSKKNLLCRELSLFHHRSILIKKCCKQTLTGLWQTSAHSDVHFWSYNAGAFSPSSWRVDALFTCTDHLSIQRRVYFNLSHARLLENYVHVPYIPPSMSLNWRIARWEHQCRRLKARLKH